MARVNFTTNLQRHVVCEPRTVEAATVCEALYAALAGNERAIGYILDDQGALRQHMIIFVDGRQIMDRQGLTDALAPDADVYVMQALSGG